MAWVSNNIFLNVFHFALGLRSVQNPLMSLEKQLQWNGGAVGYFKGHFQILFKQKYLLMKQAIKKSINA